MPKRIKYVTPSIVLILLLGLGCDNKSSIDDMSEETAKALFGDPDDERFIFSTYSYDLQDEDSAAEINEYPEADSSTIRDLVLKLPWDNSRYSVSATVGQVTIWLPNQKIISVSANAELDDGTIEKLHAEITERENGEYVRRQRITNLTSPEQIADLLISYMQQDGKYDEDFDWIDDN